MSNEDYLEKFNNLVDMAYAFNGQLHNQDIVDIVTEVKYLGGSYDILEPEKKEILLQSAKEQYLGNMNLFFRVTERDMADLLRNCKMTKPRGMKTILKTWSRHNS